jgi:DNA mismatch repair protein MutS2
LKRLDGPGTGIVNASLQFDPDRIEPTYHLQKGRPGRSYGLAIARRLGFPPELLDRAEAHVPKDEARIEDLLATLERKEKEASELVESLAREKARAQRLKTELEAREEELRSRERTAEDRAREEARRLLLNAREEVEEAIREVRSAAEVETRGQEELEEATHRARRRVEEAARRQREKRRELRQQLPVGDFSPGDRVALSGSGADGTVVEVREDRVTVETGGLRLRLPASELVRKAEPREGRPAASNKTARAASDWQGPESEPRTEVDLRGMRVAEVDLALDRAVDQAVLGGLSELRIIHGKGTGALRQRVGELLEMDGRVQEYRMGLPTEGGAGVTMVKFK